MDVFRSVPLASLAQDFESCASPVLVVIVFAEEELAFEGKDLEGFPFLVWRLLLFTSFGNAIELVSSLSCSFLMIPILGVPSNGSGTPSNTGAAM